MTESFGYDAGSYGKGRPTNVSDTSGSTSFEYSAAGDLLAQTAVIAGQSLVTGCGAMTAPAAWPE